MIVDKRISSKLIIIESIEKMYKIDEHIGFTTSGLIADARQLVDRARVQCQMNRMTYGDAIPVTTLVKRMCDHKQSFTQYGGARPYGTALLIAGVDADGVHLFETDPSGAYQSYHAGAIGKGRSEVIEYFEDNWKEGMTLNAGVKMGLTALKGTLDDDLNKDAVEIAYVDAGGYTKLDRKATAAHIGKV